MAADNAKDLISQGHDLANDNKLQLAADKFYAAIQLEPFNTNAKSAFLYTRQRMCKFDALFRTQATLLCDAIRDGKHSPPFSTFVITDDPVVQYMAACATSKIQSDSVTPYTSWKPQEGKLKIGYISSYFRRHALSVLIAEVLKMHNRDMLEIYIFAYGDAQETPERQRIMDYCDHFINLKGTPDIEAAEMIRNMGINMLVDMNGYSGHIRPGILSRRPAPVQGLWMSYPNTLGAIWSDFYISDRYIVETREHEKSFHERVYTMSRCCWTYDTQNRTIDESATRESEGLPEDAIILGNFNGTHKVSYLLLSMWMTILSSTENTYLWTMISSNVTLETLRDVARSWGIDPQRIISTKMIDHKKHLGRFRLVDLILDTFPCNGHTLSMDALWACCPMITYAGKTPISRVASSALRTQGFDDLVTHSPQEYIDLAIELIEDAPRRSSIRERMRVQKTEGLLFNQKQFVAELDSIYVRIWDDFKGDVCFDPQL